MVFRYIYTELSTVLPSMRSAHPLLLPRQLSGRAVMAKKPLLDLLLAEEHAFIDAMSPALPRESAALAGRMLMRRATSSEPAELDYAEIGSLEGAGRCASSTPATDRLATPAQPAEALQPLQNASCSCSPSRKQPRVTEENPSRPAHIGPDPGRRPVPSSAGARHVRRACIQGAGWPRAVRAFPA